MTIHPSFMPMFDRLLDFSVRAETEADVAAARAEYFAWTGEVFDEDRSFDVRMQAFLDWYVFDRSSPVLGDTPARAMAASLPDSFERQAFRLMARTVHGLFEIEEIRPTHVRVMNMLTAMPYVVEVPRPLAGVHKGDIFEGRLVPFRGSHQFSMAFIFHPPHLKRRIVREIRRQHREAPEPVQEVLWTLARMASRSEHYRNVPVDAVYDFSRPPPKIQGMPMRFDAASIAERRARLTQPSGSQVYSRP